MEDTDDILSTTHSKQGVYVETNSYKIDFKLTQTTPLRMRKRIHGLEVVIK